MFEILLESQFFHWLNIFVYLFFSVQRIPPNAPTQPVSFFYHTGLFFSFVPACQQAVWKQGWCLRCAPSTRIQIFLIRIFFPGMASVHTQPNPDIFFNPLSREKVNPQGVDDGWTGYFRIRWRNKSMSSLLPSNKPTWQHVGLLSLEWIWMRVDRCVFDWEWK